MDSLAPADDTIDATGSTLRTGSSSVRSGDIRLRVAKAVDRSTVASWILPLAADGHGNIGDPSDIALHATGEMNTGAAGDPSSLGFLLNGEPFEFTLVPGPAAGTFTHAFDGQKGLSLVRSSAGGSRYAFELTLEGPPLAADFSATVAIVPGTGFAGPGEDITFQMQPGGISGGVVPLDFDAAAGVGSYRTTPYWLQAGKVSPKGAGKDAFSLALGLAAAAEFGDSVDARATVGEASFSFPAAGGKTKGGRTTWKTKTGGGVTLVLDRAKRTVTLKGKKASIGSFPDGPATVEFLVGFGPREFQGSAVLGRKGTALVW